MIPLVEHAERAHLDHEINNTKEAKHQTCLMKDIYFTFSSTHPLSSSEKVFDVQISNSDLSASTIFIFIFICIFICPHEGFMFSRIYNKSR
ncbi:hypothetical protein Sjap_006172 [Stephania japonica]|uniref:Uncharacterized protein n=1 Tax=Stephania japonica TaxID=461633 RepID=A0AAP0K721_9MAGN